LLNAEKEYYKDLAGAEVSVIEEPIPNDPMSYTVMQKAKYNLDNYRVYYFIEYGLTFREIKEAILKEDTNTLDTLRMYSYNSSSSSPIQPQF